jgi:hypothetical protein
MAASLQFAQRIPECRRHLARLYRAKEDPLVIDAAVGGRRHRR